MSGEHREATVTIPELVRASLDAGEAVGYRNDGLFARLLCIVATLRIGEAAAVPARFLWLTGGNGANARHGYDDSISELLDDARIGLVGVSGRRIKPPAHAVQTLGPLALPGETAIEAHARTSALARSLQMAGAPLESRVRSGRFDVGIHARLTDAQRMWLLGTKFVPASGLLAIVRAAAADARPRAIYLSSDHPDFLAAAKEEFGDTVVTAEDLPDEPWATGGLGRALQDALRLASSTEIIAPPRSNLSLFASLLSDGRLVSAVARLDAPEVRDRLSMREFLGELRSVARDDANRDLKLLLPGLAPDVQQREGVQQMAARAGIRLPADGEPSVQEAVLGAIAPLRPAGIDVPLVRLGGSGDGGYVVPDDLEVKGAISIGIGPDVSFDLALAERGIPVLCVDHTIEGLPAEHRLLQHVRRPWGGRDEDGAITLAELVARLDEIVGGGDLLLKFDAEGAEYRGLADLPAGLLARFRIILGEFHDLDALATRRGVARLDRILTPLAQGHRCVHLHANNVRVPLAVRGIPIPPLVEATFLRSDRASFRTHLEPMPGPLDAPNRPSLPQVVLNPWLDASQ